MRCVCDTTRWDNCNKLVSEPEKCMIKMADDDNACQKYGQMSKVTKWPPPINANVSKITIFISLVHYHISLSPKSIVINNRPRSPPPE